MIKETGRVLRVLLPLAALILLLLVGVSRAYEECIMIEIGGSLYEICFDVPEE